MLRALIGLAVLLSVGVPARAATQTAGVQANAVKPLTVTMLQSLDLGSITLGPGNWSNATVSISRGGLFTCGTNVTCAGVTQVARYNVQGSNGQVVRISAPNVTMVNQSDPARTLTLVVDAPASVTLTNSGSPGVNFSIGGAITVNSTTQAGLYVGTFNVTCDY